MEIRKEPPEIYVFNPNKQTGLGTVKTYSEFTEDIRFNSCSEIEFTVPKFIYNLNSEKWEPNTVYAELEKYRLLYLTDDEEYFKYPVRSVKGHNQFDINENNLPINGADNMMYNQNSGLINFKLQAETMLYDIGTDNGYTFLHAHQISPSDGAIFDDSHFIGKRPGEEGYTYATEICRSAACATFVPVNAMDIIAIRTGYNGSTCLFKWHIMAYKEADPSTYVGTWVYDNQNIERVSIKNLMNNDNEAVLPDGGYIRVWFENGRDYSYSFDDDGNYSWEYTYPISGYLQIYSGERRCTSITTRNDGAVLKPQLHWFQIVDTKENGDGLNLYKTVTAYSYEYSLRNKTFSTDSSILPFFIPDEIKIIVESSQWVINKLGSTTKYASQKIGSGIFNQILDALPGWSIGYISGELATRYRTVEDVDNVDVYTYLMDTLQKTYQCFIVFNNDNQTISAYTQEDVFSYSNSDSNTPIYLTWDNSIKSFNKTTGDTAYCNTLRVKLPDESYGLGLVNPTGNALLYNFEEIENDLEYYPKPSSDRTVYEALEEWKIQYNNWINAHRTAAQNFIKANMELIKAKSILAQALSDYRAKAEVINIYLYDDYNRDRRGFQTLPRISENPIQSNSIPPRAPKFFHSEKLKNELYSITVTYENAQTKYDASLEDYNDSLSQLKGIATFLTMDYKKATSLNGNSYAHTETVLSGDEIEALNRHAIEATWINDNITFSDTYSSDDIYSGLVEAYNEAMNDLNTRLSHPNYDFEVDVVNITALPEFEQQILGLLVGGTFTLNIGDGEVLKPMLLEMHIDYKDDNNFKFTFTTDMKRKPMQFRFVDLYSTITQTSVTDNTFTFDK